VRRSEGFVDRLLSFGGSGCNRLRRRSTHRPKSNAWLTKKASVRTCDRRRPSDDPSASVAASSCRAPERFARAGGARRDFIAACFALAGANGASYMRASSCEGRRTFTLRNGLQVVVITDRRAPVVTHMVWYRVGAADEPRGYSGIAHFFEHLMFKGTREIAPGEFSRTVARNGGEDNAFTGWDYTAYYERIARDRLDLVMRMEADRMRNLRFSDETFASERDVIVRRAASAHR
jgi:hypothetical protein